MLRNTFMLIYKVMDIFRSKFERKLSIGIFLNLMFHLKQWLHKMVFTLEKLSHQTFLHFHVLQLAKISKLIKISSLNTENNSG